MENSFINRRYKVETKLIEQNIEELFMLHTVAVGDIDGDGKPDIITSNIWIEGESKEKKFRIRWYRNGQWEPYDIYVGPYEGARLYLFDITGNGRLDVVRAGRFSNILSWLEAPEDPKKGPWKEYKIDEFPVVHDICFADINNDNKMELIAGAINDEGGVIYWYNIPEDPRGQWKRNIIDGEINKTMDGDHWGGHGLDVYDIDGDGYLDVLSTSMGEGKFLWYRNPGGSLSGQWKKRIIGGSREEGTSCLIRAGKLYDDGEVCVFAGGEHSMGSGANFTPLNDKFIMFTPNNNIYDEYWKAYIIDRPGEVHDIRIADLDGDGVGEVLVANRLQNRLLCYDYDGEKFHRIVLDDSIQASEIAVEDIDGDGQLEIVAVGLRTADVKLYKFHFE